MNGPIDVRGLRHIALIMDGNGRWAQARGKTRTRGHREGVHSVREAVTAGAEAGLEWMTLFALSTENYRSRPTPEVLTLMGLLRRFLVRERPTLLENGVRLRAIGRLDELPRKVREEIARTERLTADQRGMTLVLALNYGGRAELADAAQALGRRVRAGELDPESIDEASLGAALYDPDMPDVDLLVRTAGEHRVSNFLLWQISYAEIHSTSVCWPDFRRAQLAQACDDFRSRSRRFGGLQENPAP